MHTSKLLKSSDFQYWQLTEEEHINIDFKEFCPDYHELDRVGVISPCIEDGILHTGDALLALTTAFYDTLRSHGADFFDYPQHFAFIGASEGTVHTRTERLPMDRIGTGWGNLDVWPNSKWIPTPASAIGMVEKVFNFQINRLFLPHGFKTSSDESPLPAYARKMLGTRLKAVYYYNTPVANIEIRSSQQVADLIHRSTTEFPSAESEIEHPAQSDFPSVGRYQQVSVDEFLEDMADCFDGN